MYNNNTKPTTTEILQRTQILNPVFFNKSLNLTLETQWNLTEKKINHQSATRFKSFKRILNAHHSGHDGDSKKSQS